MEDVKVLSLIIVAVAMSGHGIGIIIKEFLGKGK